MPPTCMTLELEERGPLNARAQGLWFKVSAQPNIMEVSHSFLINYHRFTEHPHVPKGMGTGGHGKW